MKFHGIDYIKIIIWKQHIDTDNKPWYVSDVIECPIRFGKDGRLSRTTSFHLKEALDNCNKGAKVVIKFDWSNTY